MMRTVNIGNTDHRFENDERDETIISLHYQSVSQIIPTWDIILSLQDLFIDIFTIRQKKIVLLQACLRSVYREK